MKKIIYSDEFFKFLVDHTLTQTIKPSPQNLDQPVLLNDYFLPKPIAILTGKICNSFLIQLF